MTKHEMSEDEKAALLDFLGYYLKETGREPYPGIPDGTGLPLARMIALKLREHKPCP